jgi:type VI secretion system secreted protein VgrG
MPIERIDRTDKVPSFSIRYKGVETAMKPVSVELKIDNKVMPQTAIETFIFDQLLGEHNILALELRRTKELEDQFGKTIENNIKAWITKTINLRITAADKSTNDNGVVNFIGIVVTATMGSEVGSLGNIYLRCLSPTVLLDSNKLYCTWLDMASQDIINGLISAEGLPNVKVSATGTKLNGFISYGQTAFRIIQYLAGFEGWWVYYDGSNFNVVKDLPESSIELKANQVSAFVLMVDLIWKKALRGREFEYLGGNWFQGQSNPQSSPSHTASKAVYNAPKHLSTSEFLRLKYSPASQGDFDQRINTALSQNYSRLMRGNGITDRLGITIGKILKFEGKNIAKQADSRREEELSGQYIITRATHNYESGKYCCEFKCVDRDLAFPYYKESEFPEQIYELAEVTDVNDPEKLGRVKVRFGWDKAQNYESPFIRVCQIVAGATPHGTWFLPEIGDSVLVSIRGPHLDNAMIVGSLYDGSRKPRNDLNTQDNMTKSFYTKSGNEIIFKDDKDAEQLSILAKGGACKISLDASNGKEMLSMAVNKDAASIVLDDGSGAAKVSITTKSSSCNITLDGQNQSIKIEAQKTIELKAAEIKITADATLEVKSNGTMKNSAAATLDLEGNAMVNVKGGIIKLN